jgi:digeranylgeranylglycerophospholipid reductase
MKRGTVKGIETLGGKKIQSDLVIDCSGPAAVVGNKLKLLPKKSDIEIGIGIEHELYNIDVRNPKSIDFYVGQKEIVPIGYGWVFPLSENIARVGVSSVYNTPELITEKNINYWHEKFLGEDSPIFKRVKNAQPYETHKGTYPLSGMLEKPYANGLLLAGDSAAQASMLVGEGIRYAMEFGKRAAETSIESIKENDATEGFLNRYVDKCIEYLGEFYEVAIDLLQVPTDEYWESLLDAMLKYKDKEPELILKYLKTEMTYEDAKEIFPKFVGKYLRS